jgi:hypothetical protein
MQHSHINYPECYKIVTDGRVLNALKKRGLINEWDKIIYNNNKYIIKYFEGCFMPFVCKVININLNDEGGKDVK